MTLEERFGRVVEEYGADFVEVWLKAIDAYVQVQSCQVGLCQDAIDLARDAGSAVSPAGLRGPDGKSMSVAQENENTKALRERAALALAGLKARNQAAWEEAQRPLTRILAGRGSGKVGS